MITGGGGSASKPGSGGGGMLFSGVPIIGMLTVRDQTNRKKKNENRISL